MITIQQRLVAAMADVGAVRKVSHNDQGNFNFRGIDAVTNAVHPALVKNGVIVVPEIQTYDYGTVTVGRNRTEMGHARVTVKYTWYGAEGDSIVTVVPGEAFDSGDKATAKAMSVAFRTAMLQTLSLPTDEADPDESTYERAAIGHGESAQRPRRRVSAAPARPDGAPEPDDAEAAYAHELDAARDSAALVSIAQRIAKDRTLDAGQQNHLHAVYDECLAKLQVPA